jgi:hypothetical protein
LVPSHGRDVSEDGRDVKHCVLRVQVLHAVELVAVPALEPVLEPIEDFRRDRLGDAPSLPPSGRDDQRRQTNCPLTKVNRCLAEERVRLRELGRAP